MRSRAIHKPYAFRQPSLGVLCGAYPFWMVGKHWRNVTCKRCLRSKGKK